MSTPDPKSLLTGPTAAPLCVVSIGECMLEIAPAGIPDHFRKSFAGDTLNTLWYLRQLMPVWAARYVTHVGRDQVSDDMVDMIAGAGIDTQYIQRSAGRTIGLYLISLNNGERSFAYWRSQSAARQLADDPAAIAAATKDADVLFFSGITLAILDIDARARFLTGLAQARQAGKTVVFDPNHRPRLWSDTATMCAALMQGAGVSDIVLPSFDEESAHFGDASPQATITRYLAAGAKTVVVKNGAGVVVYAHNGRNGTVMPAPVDVIVDTTSAGDSFNAGLLAGMGQFTSIDDAIRLACRVARQVIGQRGALVTLDINDLAPD